MTRSLSRTWLMIAGVVLIAVGLLGFIPNPLVGGENALLPTDAVHNIVHLATGALALILASGAAGSAARGAIGFGILYTVILIAVLLSPNLFGLFSIPANAVLHLIHAALAGVSLAVGYSERDQGTARATAR